MTKGQIPTSLDHANPDLDVKFRPLFGSPPDIAHAIQHLFDGVLIVNALSRKVLYMPDRSGTSDHNGNVVAHQFVGVVVPKLFDGDAIDLQDGTCEIRQED